MNCKKLTFEQKAQVLMLCEKRMREFIMQRGMDLWGYRLLDTDPIPGSLRYPILPMHDSFIVHHGWESFLQEQMDKAFEEVMGTKCRVDLKYNSIQKRQEREGGPSDSSNLSFGDLLRKTHSIYEGLLSEHRMCEHMEERRRLQHLRDQGQTQVPGTDIKIDAILNDESDEPLPF